MKFRIFSHVLFAMICQFTLFVGALWVQRQIHLPNSVDGIHPRIWAMDGDYLGTAVQRIVDKPLPSLALCCIGAAIFAPLTIPIFELIRLSWIAFSDWVRDRVGSSKQNADIAS